LWLVWWFCLISEVTAIFFLWHLHHLTSHQLCTSSPTSQYLSFSVS
jgi:hypothetical protein